MEYLAASLWEPRLDRLANYLDFLQTRRMSMPPSNALTVTVESDTQIKMQREFPARRELVFDAFTSCEHLKHWWGQATSTLEHCELDFRPGGAYRFVERDTNGEEWGFRGEIREVARPERIVQTFEWEGLPGHVSVDTMVFEDLGGRTRIVVTTDFASVEDRDGMLQSGMEQGAGESYDRLEAYLQTLS
jgi:uncharacterized protein YndB with AHSA1/START domain